MAKLQPVRGTHDILPKESIQRRHITDQARNIAARYCFDEINTPIFEFTEVFQRTLGDTSDIVSKEMYTFEDRSGASLTLRPENTAGVARALISGGLSQSLPLKFFYSGPMFRYERPQKGRLRQFHQLGVELLGVSEPIGDVEVISLGAQILSSFDILKKTTLEINTLGDKASRLAYSEAIKSYFSNYESSLSKDSILRLSKNPLRILDSKEECDIEIIKNAPNMNNFLNEYSRDFFKYVCDGLNNLGITFSLNSKLVRGLDYYNHTAFEFTTNELGAQSAVLAGGRYDGLVEAMGGSSIPGVGWAAGLERISLLFRDEVIASRPISVIPIGVTAETEGLKLANELRASGFTIDIAYRGNLSKRMKRANKVNSYAAIIIGDDELNKKTATLRNLDTGEQQEIKIDKISETMEHIFPKTLKSQHNDS